MRYFLKRGDPPLTRVLLIESGSRSLLTKMPGHLNRHFGQDVEIDLVTCYPGLPEGFPPDTPAWRVFDYPTPEKRAELVKLLLSRNYSGAGMICSGEPIMTRWKMMLAWRLPAKFFIINENGDYFWLHRDNADTIKRFVRARLGLNGEGSLRTVGRLLAFPFGLAYLILYAAFAHARRRLWLAFH